MDGSALLRSDYAIDHAVALQSENLTALMEALNNAEIEKLREEQARRERQVDADKLRQYDLALGGLINALNRAMASMNAGGGVAMSITGIVASIEGMRMAIQLHLAKIALQENKADASGKPALVSVDGRLVAPQAAPPGARADGKSKPAGIAAQAARFEKSLTALKDNKALPFPIRSIIENVLNGLQKLGVSSRSDLKMILRSEMTPRRPANDVSARIETRNGTPNDSQPKSEAVKGEAVKSEVGAKGIKGDVKPEARCQTLKSETLKGGTPKGEAKLGATSDIKVDAKPGTTAITPSERSAATADVKSAPAMPAQSAPAGISTSPSSVATSTTTASVAHTFTNPLGTASVAGSVTASAAAPVGIASASVTSSSVAAAVSSPTVSAPAASTASSAAPTFVAPVNAMPLNAPPANAAPAAAPLASVTVLSEYRASHPPATPTVAIPVVSTPTVVTPTVNVTPATAPVTPMHVAPTTPADLPPFNPMGGGIENKAVPSTDGKPVIIDNKSGVDQTARREVRTDAKETADTAKDWRQGNPSTQEANTNKAPSDTPRNETPDAHQQKNFLSNVNSTLNNVTNNMTTSVKGIVTQFINAAKGMCEHCTHSCPGCPKAMSANQMAALKAQFNAEFDLK